MDIPRRPQAKYATLYDSINIYHIAAQLLGCGIDAAANLNQIALFHLVKHLVILASPLFFDGGRRYELFSVAHIHKVILYKGTTNFNKCSNYVQKSFVKF